MSRDDSPEMISGGRPDSTTSARRRPTWAAWLLGLLAVPIAASCAGGPEPLPPARAPSAGSSAPVTPPPARYFLTASLGAIFDEATRGVAVPRAELAIVQGRRVQLDGGAVVRAARSPAGLVGFRSLPERLGGGFLVWSDVRTYHAKDFLGALTPVAEVGPTAGTRPWFGVVVLRSERGLFALDVKTRSLTRFRPQPGVVDVLSIDEKRGVTLDIVGRVRATTDGGATFTDITASRGFFANAARTGKKGEIELVSLTGAAELQLAPGANAVEPVVAPPAPFGRRPYGYGPYPYQYVNTSPLPEPEGAQPFSQQLAPDALLGAASAGVLLPGDRVIVGRDAGVFVLSTKSGGELSNVGLLDVDPQYANCQPVRAGSALLLACAHARGAEVLRFDGPLAAPKLEATFPDAFGTFIADERGHLAFTGRCGRTPPSVDDFGERVVQRLPEVEEDPYAYGPYGGYNPDYPEPPPEEPPEKEKPPADEKRLCARLDGGDWIEHQLDGDDAKDLYRWVLGDDGAVTALLLEGMSPAEPEDDEKHRDEDDGPLRGPMEGATAAPRSDLLASPTAQPRAAPRPPPAPKPGATGQAKAGAAPQKSPPKSAPAKAPAKPAAPPKDAAEKTTAGAPKAYVVTVRLDPKDRGLRRGKWIKSAMPLQQAPWRSIDPNFWLEADGSIRGWVRLPDEDGGSEPARGDENDSEHEPQIAEELSGRFAGVRVSAQGKATIFPLPAHARSVLFGGRFGFARADDDSGERTQYFETTDGGATWTEVEGPPTGDMEDVYDDSRWPACSAVGCALSSGMVRVGWGAPKPPPAKKEKDPPSAADPFPVPRLPKLECRFEGEPEVFPAPPPKPKADARPGPKPPPGPAQPGNAAEDIISRLPPDLQAVAREIIKNGGSLPPGMFPTDTDTPPPPPAPPAAPSGKPKAGKPAPVKAPPLPPADIISLRTKAQSPLGQLKDKSWIADFVTPFDPGATVKHVSIAAAGLEKLSGAVVPVLSDRGTDLLLAWDKRRTVLGASSPVMVPFEFAGRLTSAVVVNGAATAKGSASPWMIAALDEDRRVLLLVQPDASRPVLRTAKIPDPTRGHLAVARRLDAPGAAVIWYSAQSGEVFAGAIDFARAEVGALAPLASISTLTDGGLPACSTSAPSGPTYQFLAELALPVSVSAHSGKQLFNESATLSTVLIRASASRLCVAGVEVRGGGRPLDLTVTLGPRGAAVARSRTSAEDPTKLSTDKLSCLLKEVEPR